MQDVEPKGKANAYAYEFNVDQPTGLRIHYCAEEKSNLSDDIDKEIDDLSVAFNQKLQCIIGNSRSLTEIDLAKAAVSGLLGGIMYKLKHVNDVL